MNLLEVEALLRDAAGEVEGEDGSWEFEFDGVRMACLTDLDFDRMRVIAPICEDDDMTPEQTSAVLEANFHTALDARYGTSDGVLYAAFLHPLASLSEGDMRNAMEQVAGLVQTYGTTYAGGAVVFGVPDPDRFNVN